ncbi:MAG: DUF1569 domain-containing protein [Bacteroidia bacterium]
MKTVNQQEVKMELLGRIKKISPASLALWGKMNAHQVICHLTDQLRDLEGERPVKYRGNPVLKFIVRPLLSRIENWPKAIFPAAPDYDQLKNGTRPTDFETDKQKLLQMFAELDMSEAKKLPLHPAFGKLTNEQYARIVYKHFDHHLKQFGV